MRRQLLNYSELVSGLVFNVPSVNDGEPFIIGPGEWVDLHRAILGDFLGRLCASTYELGGFMGSALVVSASDDQPSEGFKVLMRELGALKSRSESEFLEFWPNEVNRAYEWYASNPA